MANIRLQHIATWSLRWPSSFGVKICGGGSAYVNVLKHFEVFSLDGLTSRIKGGALGRFLFLLSDRKSRLRRSDEVTQKAKISHQTDELPGKACYRICSLSSGWSVAERLPGIPSGSADQSRTREPQQPAGIPQDHHV